MSAKKQDRQRVYKVIFNNQGKTFEIYARQVSQGSIFGFVEIEELLFGERSQVVVDPSEESLKHEFDGVHRFFVPLHSIVRIDEVDKQGAARITGGTEDGGNVASFPVPAYTPKPD